MAQFLDPTIAPDADVAQIEQAIYNFITSYYPNWEPNDGNLEVWISKAVARIGGDIWDLTKDVTTEIFKQFGQTIVNIPPIGAQVSTGLTTWTMVDDGGYTIRDGTMLSITPSPSDDPIGFVVVGDFVVPSGSTTTGLGEVVIQSIETGAATADLTGDPELIDALAFVADNGIAMEGATTGGADDEDADVYLNRLVEEIQLFSPRPVVARDFATLAKRVPGVARAVGIDNLNPVDHTTDNEKMVAIAAVDANGVAVGAGVKDQIEALYAINGPYEREANFIVNVFDVTVNEVDIDLTVKARPQWDTVVLQDVIDGKLREWLNPIAWGTDPYRPGIWNNTKKITQPDIIQQAMNARGVFYITAGPTFALHGDPLGTADLDLVGDAPVVVANTITVTVTP
jgi:hypothetical protein